MDEAQFQKVLDSLKELHDLTPEQADRLTTLVVEYTENAEDAATA
jgi:hypothetical protein